MNCGMCGLSAGRYLKELGLMRYDEKTFRNVPDWEEYEKSYGKRSVRLPLGQQ